MHNAAQIPSKGTIWKSSSFRIGTTTGAYIVKLLAEGRCRIAYDAMAVPFYELQSQVTYFLKIILTKSLMKDVHSYSNSVRQSLTVFQRTQSG